jgi:hypothetical protein
MVFGSLDGNVNSLVNLCIEVVRDTWVKCLICTYYICMHPLGDLGEHARTALVLLTCGIGDAASL